VNNDEPADTLRLHTDGSFERTGRPTGRADGCALPPGGDRQVGEDGRSV